MSNQEKKKNPFSEGTSNPNIQQEPIQLALEELEQLQLYLDQRTELVVEEGKGKQKREVAYPESREGQIKLARIEELKNQYKNSSLFQEYLSKREEQRLARTEERRKNEQIADLKRQIHDQENPPDSSMYETDPSKRAVEFSPEESEEMRLKVEKIRQEKEKVKQIPKAKQWWKFW